MGNQKLAQQIARLANEIESVHTATTKVAEKMVKFQDDAGNAVLLPYDQVGNVRWVYSPFDRTRAERTDVINVTLTGQLADAFHTASVKTAERMVQFTDESGRTFMLPQEQVGTARWTYSPFDRSRAQRSGIINVQLNDRLEDAFGLTV